MISYLCESSAIRTHKTWVQSTRSMDGYLQCQGISPRWWGNIVWICEFLVYSLAICNLYTVHPFSHILSCCLQPVIFYHFNVCWISCWFTSKQLYSFVRRTSLIAPFSDVLHWDASFADRYSNSCRLFRRTLKAGGFRPKWVEVVLVCSGYNSFWIRQHKGRAYTLRWCPFQ